MRNGVKQFFGLTLFVYGTIVLCSQKLMKNTVKQINSLFLKFVSVTFKDKVH